MMQTVKKNILSILCGVVVIIAIVAYFVVVQGMYYGDDGLQKQADERKAQYERLAGLLGKPRSLPVVEIDKTEPVPLTAYPTLPIIQKGQQVTKDLQAQAKRITELAANMNRKEPLVRGVFPKGTDTDKFAFRDAYEQWVTKYVPEMLNAANPPTEEDIALAEQKLWDDKYAKEIYFVEENGQRREYNREVVDQRYLAEIQDLREKMERETAEKFRVYLDPTAVTTNTALFRAEQSPHTNQVWYAQTALWVQQDLAASMAALNDRVLRGLEEKERNIINAPVKHIVAIEVPEGIAQFLRAAPPSGSEETAAISTGPEYSVSPTGRTSGSIYDVVKFTLVVKMDAAYVPALIQELSRGKFITTHKVDLSSVDSQLAREEGFFYGPNPVVKATITGEALLLREWTTKLMPDPVKKELPGADAPAAAAPETPVASR
jgi:hypothetical protein